MTLCLFFRNYWTRCLYMTRSLTLRLNYWTSYCDLTRSLFVPSVMRVCSRLRMDQFMRKWWRCFLLYPMETFTSQKGKKDEIGFEERRRCSHCFCWRAATPTTWQERFASPDSRTVVLVAARDSLIWPPSRLQYPCTVCCTRNMSWIMIFFHTALSMLDQPPSAEA